jgi:hypothetical protein
VTSRTSSIARACGVRIGTPKRAIALEAATYDAALAAYREGFDRA